MSIDTIADMLSALKNAAAAGKTEVVVPYSRFKEQLAKLLESEGFAAEVRKFKEQGGSRFSLSIKLSCNSRGEPKIEQMRRISRPGQRIYLPYTKIKSPSKGVKIVSTSQGLLTDKQARKKHLGGEVIAEVG